MILSKSRAGLFGAVFLRITIILNSAVAGPKAAHLAKITAAFEFSVLTLMEPGFKPPKS